MPEKEKFYSKPEESDEVGVIEEEDKDVAAEIDPETGMVLSKKEVEERKKKREENPDWFREN